MRIKKQKRKASEAEAPFDGAALPIRPFKFLKGFREETVEVAWTINGTRGTIATFRDKGGEWFLIHVKTSRLIFAGAPTREYAEKVAALILPHLDLHKLYTRFWDVVPSAIPDEVRDYLSHVWKCSYPIDEIPTVKKWSSSGCGSSAKPVQSSRGVRIKLKRRKR